MFYSQVQIIDGPLQHKAWANKLSLPQTMAIGSIYYLNLRIKHVNYVQSTCTEYMSGCYTTVCYVIVGCCAVPCPKNFSAQSDPVLLCASDNKRLVTCNLTGDIVKYSVQSN